MYCNEAQIDRNDYLKVLMAAAKFELTELADIIVNDLIQGLNSYNAFSIYEQTHQLDLARLEKGISTLLQYNENCWLNEYNIQTLNRSSMKFLLSQPRLAVSESELFDLTLHWARVQIKKQTNQEIPPQMIRETMGDLLYLLRIPLLKTEDLMRGPAKSGLFSNEDILDIINYQTSAEHEKNGIVSQFNLEPRSIPQLISIKMIPAVVFDKSYRLDREYNSFSISFLSSFDFCLAGFRLESRKQLKMTVKVISARETLYSSAFDLHDLVYDGQGYHIRFEQCVPIGKGLMNEIYVHFDQTYYDHSDEVRKYTQFIHDESVTYTVSHLFRDFRIEKLNAYTDSFSHLFQVSSE